MGKSELAEFMDGAASRPYRELVEHHLQRESEYQMRLAVSWECSQLPEHMQTNAITFIDVANQLAYNRQFWATETCRDAYNRFIKIAVDVFDDKAFVGATNNPFWLQDEELGFRLFQIQTLSFAYSAISQRKMRRFMGIRNKWRWLDLW